MDSRRWDLRNANREQRLQRAAGILGSACKGKLVWASRCSRYWLTMP
ncbi:hypothetical protein [Collimonas silvisoli]|nr:hypothetical protein [Collimonas silvisoli]